MKPVKKVERAKEAVKKNLEVLRCPLCREDMVIGTGGIVCSQGHRFDFSRKGYLNFLSAPVKRIYQRDLFSARREISEQGFFDPLVEMLAELILEEWSFSSATSVKLLDAGCGEGSLLGHILYRLQASSGVQWQGFGVDISKEGIQLATNQDSKIIWLVADLARLPFKDRSMNLLVNILSPANYSEFGRVITQEGTLIKVIPGRDYLKEMRQVLNHSSFSSSDSQQEVVEQFRRNFNLRDLQQLSYRQMVSSRYLPSLLRMTPLSWNTPEADFQRILNRGLSSVTVDLTVIRGKKTIF